MPTYLCIKASTKRSTDTIGKRIADLVFLLNKLEEQYPIHHNIYNIDTYFEYRIAQYQQSKPHE